MSAVSQSAESMINDSSQLQREDTMSVDLVNRLKDLTTWKILWRGESYKLDNDAFGLEVNSFKFEFSSDFFFPDIGKRNV